MNTKTIIVGAGGSGKDYLKQKFIDKGFESCVCYTTRPIREEEIEGKTYRFVNEALFELLKENEMFAETTRFNEWQYGTPIADFKTKNIFIMTPLGLSKIPKEIRDQCLVIYLDIPRHIRRSRLLQRNDVDSAHRRITADEQDFFEFKDYDIRITNENF